MATTANIYTLLKFYASHQNSAVIDYGSFADYLKRYAQHHLEENQDLIAYVGSSDEPLRKELDDLVEANQIVIVSPSLNRKFIFVGAFFIEKYTKIYQEIETNPTIPFPNITDLPKNTPAEILTRRDCTDLLHQMLKDEDPKPKSKILYGITFTNKDLPMLIYPSNVPTEILFNASIAKIQEMLKKEESHDYFRRKLIVSNPGKEMTAKSFFEGFMQKPENALDNLKNSGENFYFWSQLLYFIRQDFEKVKDFTIEDMNILQSVHIIESITAYLKSRVMEQKQKETAFNTLVTLLKHPPYHYTYTEIIKMKDPAGIPIIGQITEEELREWLQEQTTQAESDQLPPLLIIKVSDSERYFILKEKVMSLVVRLCADARVTVKANLSLIWNKTLMEYDSLPEMKEQEAFEKCLHREVQATQPILYAILNSSFLPLISYYDADENDETFGRLTLFRDGILIPYSEILMVSRSEIITDVKIKLPFWYTTPIISWIAAFLSGKRKSKVERTRKAQKTAAEQVLRDQKTAQAEKDRRRNEELGADPRQSRKQELHKAAIEVEKQLVPPNSTLDRELYSYCHEWNMILGKEARNNLTEDVNSLIRDYMRKVMRTLKGVGFTQERIKSLAESLVASPAMQKIKNHEALEMYVQLYIIKLVKNIP